MPSKYLYNILNVCIILSYVDMWQFIEILLCFAFRRSLHFLFFSPNLKTEASTDTFAAIYLCTLLMISLVDISIIVGSKERHALHFFDLYKLGAI